MGVTASHSPEGVIRVLSHLPYRKTVEGLLIALKRRGMLIDARIDHTANAAAAGLSLRPEEVVIFTFPEAEGAILQRCPALGVELPRRILVSEDQEGQVWLAYNDPRWLGRRFAVAAEVASLLKAMAASLEGIVLEGGGRTSTSPLPR